MPFSAPLRLAIDGDALVANWRWLATRGGAAACGAAIKADGYGLGARAVLARLAAAGCRDFFVSTWAEAEALGPWPDGIAVAVLHGVREEDMATALASPARPVLNTAAQVARWKAAGGGACDVMVDTGMNRLGISPNDAVSGLLDGLVVETLMSHLACADEPAHVMNERQRATFATLRDAVPARRASLANSAGIMLGAGYAFDLTRPGLSIYGGHPTAASAPIRQVARPMAEVVQCRRLLPGDTIGYGATWTAADARQVAILNIGYADGYVRAFAGTGAARAGGICCPLRGRVSMDLLAVDVGAADVAEGDWLELEFALPEAAAATGMSQYELLTGLGHRYERRWT